MLKLRLLSAIILIPIFVFLILNLSPYSFGIMTIAFVLLGAWEWAALMGIKNILARMGYASLIFILLHVSIFIPIHFLMLGAALWWCFALLLVLLYPATSSGWGNSQIIRGLMGVLIFIPTWRALNFLRDTDMFGVHHGPYILLFLFVLIWGADTGAYFAGKLWGKTKLLPKVSPGKTWQGLFGALLITLLIAPALLLLHTKLSVFSMVGLSLITVLVSILGDLFESMMKRNVGLKDSGTLIPGHGGLLDRIDSLTAAAPIFVLGILML